MTSPLLTFDAPTHRYTLTGSRVHSVTQILQKVGAIDFRHVTPSYLEAARVRGTVVHQACHYYNEHDLDVAEFCTTFPEYAGYLRSWIALVETGRLRPALCEHRVGNFAPRYAGTFDWLGWFDGEAALIDYATGNPDDVCKNLQTAGYVLAARAWSEVPGEDVLKAFHDAHTYVVRYAVRLHPDGNLPAISAYRDPRDFSTFLLLAHAVAAVDEIRASSIDEPWTHDTEVAS